MKKNIFGVLSFVVRRICFLDLKITFQKSLARLFIILMSAIAAGMISVFLFSPFEPRLDGNVMALFFLFVIIYAASFPYFQKNLYPFILSLLSPKEFMAEERLNEMYWWGGMTQLPTMQEAYQQIASDIASYVDLEDSQNGVSICLYDVKEKKFYLVWPHLDYKKICISTDTLLSYEMEKTAQKILVTDELQYLSRQNSFYASRYEKLIEELRSLRAEVFIPLTNGSTLGSYVGLILLGKKKDGKPYSTNEVEYLRKLSDKIKVKLMHTMIYAGAEERMRNILEQRKKLKMNNEISVTQFA